jgi:hypothetical protein
LGSGWWWLGEGKQVEDDDEDEDEGVLERRCVMRCDVTERFGCCVLDEQLYPAAASFLFLDFGHG